MVQNLVGERLLALDAVVVRVHSLEQERLVVVVYHVTIVAIGHGFLKKFWPIVIGCVLRTAGSFIILNYADPFTSLELLNCNLTLSMRSGKISILCHST